MVEQCLSTFHYDDDVDVHVLYRIRLQNGGGGVDVDLDEEKQIYGIGVYRMNGGVLFYHEKENDYQTKSRRRRVVP